MLRKSTYKDYACEREEHLLERMDRLNRNAAGFEKIEKTFDYDKATTPVCKWGNTRIKRFIYRYVSYLKDKHKPDRDFVLAQLRSLAEENGIDLPSETQINIKKPKDRLVSEIVDISAPPKVSDYNFYFDGSNYVACLKNENIAIQRERYELTKWDTLFDSEYAVLRKLEIFSEKDKSKEEKFEIRNRLESELVSRFYRLYDYDDRVENEPCPLFINRKITNLTAAYNERRKRFYRKKDQIKWTAWWTITYDPDKFISETDFRRALLTKFRNLCVRRCWRIMGVFEHGEENGRLHFHGFFYIPKGQEIGIIKHAKHWSTKQGRWIEYEENTEFKRLFGTNTYEDISEMISSGITTMADYTAKMLRYMDKGEKVYYSRHIPTEFLGSFLSHDMLIAFSVTCKRSIKRYVINPDVIFRSDTVIRRIEPPKENKWWDTSEENRDPYAIGLIDDAA